VPVSREIPPSAVDRPRLIERLDRGARERLTLVLGPSGSGKSVLLRQWAAIRPGTPTPWVRIGAHLGDGVALGRQLVASVAHHHPGFGAGPLRHLELGGERMGPSFLEAFRAELSGLPPTVLVLEDLHDLPPPLVDELGWLVQRCPPPLHLLVASRVQPPWPMSRLRAQGRLAELLAPDLALTPDESGELVARVAGVALDGEQLARLHRRTEGWVLGVHLCALAMRGGDVDAVLDPARGAVELVADHLVEEVVAQQDPDVLDFLRRTSVLDRLDADICDVLTGRSDSQRVLVDLERRNLFVVGLDGRRGSFRYHPLLAQLLRDQLAAEDPAVLEALLVRAADWHLARDETGPAIEYLLRAQRWDQALDALAADGWAFYARGESTTAIRWLESVPRDVRRAHRYAEGTLITLHRLTGNCAVADRLLEERARTCVPGSRKDMGRHVLSAGGLLWGHDPAEVLGHAEVALAWLADPPPGEEAGPGQAGDVELQAACRLSGGRALHLLGRWDEARRWFEEALALSAASPAYHLRALAALARLEADAGRLETAYVTARRALKFAEEIELDDPTPLAEAHLALGQVGYERDELADAVDHLREAEAQARVSRCTVVVALAVAARAEAAMADGAHRAGLELLARWRREGDVVPRHDLPEAVAARLAGVEVRLLLALGELARARRVLGRAPHAVATAAAASQLAAAQGDLPGLDAVLRRWPASPEVRPRIQHRMWLAVLAERAGDAAGATGGTLAAVGLAQVDGHRRAFLDAGPEVVDLLDVVARRLPGTSEPGAGALVELCEALRSTGPAEPSLPPLADPLSRRELEALRHLTSRLTVPEIAERMGVSTNTLKTHVKRTYRKLGVGDRRAAVEAGQALGLLRAGTAP
jgi:LuxR family maltose regulon positive regulatory protein